MQTARGQAEQGNRPIDPRLTFVHDARFQKIHRSLRRFRYLDGDVGLEDLGLEVKADRRFHDRFRPSDRFLIRLVATSWVFLGLRAAAARRIWRALRRGVLRSPPGPDLAGLAWPSLLH